MGIDKKRFVLDDLAPNVAIVQELSKSAALLRETGVSSVWATPGKSELKGFAVIGFDGWTIERLDTPTPQPWVLPCRVSRPDGTHWANVLAIWTHKSQDDGRPPYAQQFQEAIKAWSTTIESTRTLAVGDLNASIQGPSRGGHEESLRCAQAVGLESAYHAARNEEHGAETSMTLKWIGPGKKAYYYHCDFIFAPRSMTSGSRAFVHPLFATATGHVSDHQPVVVDFID